MSKNLTLKGAAFGALLALSISAVAPASAAGLADTSFVSLAPTSGSAYTVLSGNGKTFSLTSNEASSIAGSGRNLKFLVNDTNSIVEPTTASTVRTYSITTSTAVALASNVASFAVTNNLVAGDRVSFPSNVTNTNGTIIAAGTYAVAAGTTSSSIKVAYTGTDAASANAAAASTVKVLREARAADGSFVVDSGIATDATNEVLVLAQANETTSRSIEVTAWVDSNGNEAIDSTEYVSPTRTVNFKKASEITAAVTWTAPVLGDSTVVAKVATTPELNGSQMSANDVSVKFTRQGSTSTLAASATDSVGNGSGTAGSTAWNSTDKVWVGTAYMTQQALDTPWVGAASSADTVVAGTYTARPYIGSDAIASAVATEVSSLQADDVKATIAATADNASGANSDGSSATTVAVRTGKSVTVTAKVYDSTGALVGAGVPVTATLSSVTGTVKVDGSATSSAKSTDASGAVSYVVTTTSALATDAASLTIQAQNVSTNTKQALYTFDWADATASLYDAAVAVASSNVSRSTTVGGSQSFSFRLLDQFKQPLTGSYRLKVANTGRTVVTSYATVSNGSADVTVTDAAIGAGTTITTTVDVEKDVTGTWTDQSIQKVYTTTLLTQTDKVTLDTDGNSTYGSGTADDSDALAADKTAAVDSRSSFATVPTYTNAVTVTGRVAHATTAAVRAGAKVTVTGDASFLFSSGGVYSYGSITLVTDSSGEFSVDVYSNKAAVDSVVTVSSNGVSATRKVTFTKAARDTASAINITAASIVKSGKTFFVTVDLKDAYGNAVVTDSAAAGYVAGSTAPTFSVTYTGPGFVTSTIPSVTDANGQIKFVVLLGSDDTGFGSISAAYDSNGATDNVAGTTLTATATKNFLVAVSASVSAGSKKANVVVKNASGATVKVVSGSKSTTKVATSDSFKVSLTKLTAGKKTVKVYVNDILVSSKSVAVKK